MIRTILTVAAALAIAIGGGAWLSSVALKGTGQFGGVTIGAWTAFPLAGTPEADPYAKARLARDAALSLGAAEGVTFYAARDSNGAALDSKCLYTVEGDSPSARLWTIYALAKDYGRLAGVPDEWPSRLHSQSIFYGDRDRFAITVSPHAQPNNWLAVPPNTGFQLALNLYDSPVATNKGLVDTSLPAIKKGVCDG